MRILAIVQARSGSTRLPGKVSLPLGDGTVLSQVMRRVSSVPSVDEVVLATTIEHKDLGLVLHAATLGYRVFPGSVNDVLDRFYQISRLCQPEHIVRITADCPVLDPYLVESVIQLHLKESADYTSNVLVESFPDGLDVEVFTSRSLELAWSSAKLTSEREHVTPYIRSRPSLFKLRNYRSDLDLSGYRWTVDEEPDYEFVSALYENLFDSNPLFGMHDILTLLQQYPELSEINSSIRRNEGYLKSLVEDGNGK